MAFLVTIVGQNYEAMADLVRKHRIEVFEHSARRLEGGRFRVDATLDDRKIRELEADGYAVERHERVEHIAQSRQKEVGRGDRYRRSGPG